MICKAPRRAFASALLEDPWLQSIKRRESKLEFSRSRAKSHIHSHSTIASSQQPQQQDFK